MIRRGTTMTVINKIDWQMVINRILENPHESLVNISLMTHITLEDLTKLCCKKPLNSMSAMTNDYFSLLWFYEKEVRLSFNQHY